VATRKQKLRAEAAETPLGKTVELPSAKKTEKHKKTSRGK
jgi:hypothetical protein